MTIKELAYQFEGYERDAFDDFVTEFQERAAESGAVIIFGGSDDCMELRGAIDDEVDACDASGVVAWIDSDGLIENDCEDDSCPYFGRVKASAFEIRAYWEDPTDDARTTEGWTYRLPDGVEFATFTILEDGEPWCRGLVFEMPKGSQDE